MQGYNPLMNAFPYRLLSLLIVLLMPVTYAQAPAPQNNREVQDAKVQEIHVKDEAVTIDELRIRGETRRMTVTPKNAPAYQIEPDTGRKALDDKSQGQRTWRLFSF